MLIAHISRRASIHPGSVLALFLYLVLLIMVTSCAIGPVSSANPTPTSVVASQVKVGPKPEIIVKGTNALQLTFVGSDTQSISTDLLGLPYKKAGNQVTIDLGRTIDQNVEIRVPREANLNVSLAEGNVVFDTIQGQVTMTLTSGTIQIKNFAPHGTNSIQTQKGTIGVTFANKASCNLKAQTNFGAIASKYSAISEKRSDMKSEASGPIGGGSGATVDLSIDYGSITLGPA